jgi:hypothetical protein
MNGCIPENEYREKSRKPEWKHAEPQHLPDSGHVPLAARIDTACEIPCQR